MVHIGSGRYDPRLGPDRITSLPINSLASRRKRCQLECRIRNVCQTLSVRKYESVLGLGYETRHSTITSYEDLWRKKSLDEQHLQLYGYGYRPANYPTTYSSLSYFPIIDGIIEAKILPDAFTGTMEGSIV